jgi:hypothetical protein
LKKYRGIFLVSTKDCFICIILLQIGEKLKCERIERKIHTLLTNTPVTKNIFLFFQGSFKVQKKQYKEPQKNAVDL